VPFADDPLLAELRAARPEAPDALVDPHAPANQAILQTILDGGAAEAGEAGDPLDRRRRRRRRRRVLLRVAAVAAVAAAVAGTVVVWPFGAAEPSAADVVRSSIVASEAALGSGRASLTVTTESDGLMGDSGTYVSTYEYSFAGDDVGVEMQLSPGSSGAGARRIVDGELYWHVGDDPSAPWFHQTGVGPQQSDWTGDPRSLLVGLDAQAGFEIVGDDTVDGADVTHLRATTPGNVDASQLSLGEASMSLGTTDALDVWVDDDDVVRRIDLTVRQTFDVTVDDVPAEHVQVITGSVVFHDIGVPNEIEAPTDLCEVSVEQMANPPPMGTDVC
jgi:hypothetical protein